MLLKGSSNVVPVGRNTGVKAANCNQRVYSSGSACSAAAKPPASEWMYGKPLRLIPNKTRGCDFRPAQLRATSPDQGKTPYRWLPANPERFNRNRRWSLTSDE